MNKKLMILTCASVLFLGANNGFAIEPPVKGPQMKPAQEMQMPKHNKKGMHGKKLAEKLGLTAEQQKKAEEIRKADFEKMKPLMEEMKKLREKMDEMRKENMKSFEAILTPEQKTKFEEIKAKHKEKMNNFKKDRHHKGKGRHEGKGPRHNEDKRPEKPLGEPKPEAK